MTQEEKDIVLHGAKFEMMNRCIDFNDGTVDREKMLNAMQRYAEMYHDNELSKLRQHDVSVVNATKRLKASIDTSVLQLCETAKHSVRFKPICITVVISSY